MPNTLRHFESFPDIGNSDAYYARALGLISDERLLEAVGPVAARRLGLPAPSLSTAAICGS